MAINETARKVFLAYFITHIPATMLIDAQVVLPERVVPTFAKRLLRWHIETNDDVLMANRPRWLVGFVTCELLFQLPFFFYAVSALRRRDNGARGGLLAYGAHTATTLVPILQYIWEYPSLGNAERWRLIAIYLPYLVVPLWIVWCVIGEGEPFPAKPKTRRKRA